MNEPTIRADWLDALCRLLQWDLSAWWDYRITLQGLNKAERREVNIAICDQINVANFWKRVNQSN